MADKKDTPNEPLDEDVEGSAGESVDGPFRSRRKRRLVLGVLGAALAAIAIYLVHPWILPPYIVEGPMVQMAGEHGATLVWYSSRPGVDGFQVAIGDARSEPVVASAEGRRCRAVLDGLRPGTEYTYRIVLNGRTLAQAALQTNKPAGDPFKFLVFGDSGMGTAAQYELGAQMLARDADFILHTGDLIYSGGQRYHYGDRFFRPYAEMLEQINFWPCIGNHDVRDEVEGAAYFDVFDVPQNGPAGVMPERNYWFDYASARIAVVDSELEERELRDRVAPWLIDVFADCDAVWRFVAIHRPPYTGGSHAPREEVQRALVPVFEELGIDIVFSGHDHMYERTYPMRDGAAAEDGNGVVYIVSGAGGAQLYDLLPEGQFPQYVAFAFNQLHSFSVVSVDGAELTIEQIALGGATVDTWTLRKDRSDLP